MYAEVDVFVGNNTLVDPEIYQYWLDGYTAQEAASRLLQLHRSSSLAEVPLDHLISHVSDHFRNFHMVERYLHQPTTLADQWTFQLAPVTRKMLIERYYEFDDVVIREFLGKKLSSRNRKELEEVSERTNINVKSCRRQFDNVKRVYKMVEDLTGPLVANIQTSFLLPEHLARKYGAIVFLTNSKFETTKKKLHYLQLEDYLSCAHLMLTHWCGSHPDTAGDDCGLYHLGGVADESPLELDRELMLELRELKVLTERDHLEEHRALTLTAIRHRITSRTLSDLEAGSFKTLSRGLVTIACGLNQSKELRDLFVDLVEK
ncbi:FIBP, partial [Cordylochernes scorpioides]